VRYDVIEARALGGHTVWLRFRDGAEGEVDLSNVLNGPIFEPLRDELRFRELSVNAELGTIVWPNGADVAPEYLHAQLQLARQGSAR
jgi:hypothetical protein